MGKGSTRVTYPAMSKEEKALIAQMTANAGLQGDFFKKYAPVFGKSVEWQHELSQRNYWLRDQAQQHQISLNNNYLQLRQDAQSHNMALDKARFGLAEQAQEHQIGLSNRYYALQERAQNAALAEFNRLKPSDALVALRDQVSIAAGERNLKAIRGELDVPRHLRQGFADAEATLRSRFRQQQGSGFETSSAFNQALAQLALQRETAFDSARRDDLSQAGVAFNQAFPQSLAGLGLAQGGISPALNSLSSSGGFNPGGTPTFTAFGGGGGGGGFGGARAFSQGLGSVNAQLGNISDMYGRQREGEFRAAVATAQSRGTAGATWGNLFGNIFGTAAGLAWG